MKKYAPLAPAGLMLILWLILQAMVDDIEDAIFGAVVVVVLVLFWVIWNKVRNIKDSRHFIILFAVIVLLAQGLFLGISSIYMEYALCGTAMLLLYAAAWEKGGNPEEPIYKAILLSLGGFLLPAILDNWWWQKIAAIIGILIYFAPVALIWASSYLLKKKSFLLVRKYLGDIRLWVLPIAVVLMIVFEYLLTGWKTLSDFFLNILRISIFALNTVLAVRAKAVTDPQERRREQWKSWKIILLAGILFGTGFLEEKEYNAFAYYFYTPILRLSMPLILWWWKNRLQCLNKSTNCQTALYFGGALLLNVLQAGGLYFLMVSHTFILYAEWMLIGTLAAVLVYWQRPQRFTVTGTAGNLVYFTASAGLLFTADERLREIVYDLGGPAVNIDLSTRADWIGFRLGMIKGYISGDMASLIALYEDTENDGFISDLYNGITGSYNEYIPCAFPITLILFILAIVMAVVLVKHAGNRKAAEVFALSMVLQAALFAIERTMMIGAEIALPFTGAYFIEFILVWWMIKPTETKDLAETECVSNREDTSASQEISDPSTEAHEKVTKRLNVIILALLALCLFCRCGSNLVYGTNLEKKLLETYTLTAEDQKEWNAAAEKILQIIVDEKPYYLTENRAGLSAEECKDWRKESVKFIGTFLSTYDYLEPSAARNAAGELYIKSSVVHALLGDDTTMVKDRFDEDIYGGYYGFCGDGRYVPYARLENLKVKRFANRNYEGVSDFSINGTVVSFVSWFTDEEKEKRKELYEQVAADYSGFFSSYDEPILRYCFADAILAMQHVE